MQFTSFFLFSHTHLYMEKPVHQKDENCNYSLNIIVVYPNILNKIHTLCRKIKQNLSKLNSMEDDPQLQIIDKTKGDYHDLSKLQIIYIIIITIV